MAGFGIEDAAFAGVGLLGRKPLAAVAWALVYAVFLTVVLVPFAGPLVAFVTTVAKSGGHPATEDLLPDVGGLLGLFVLLGLGSLVVGAVISCAVFRAVLQPENSSFAYLRLGSEELWVLLVSFVRGLFTALLQVVLTIPVGIVVGLLAISAPGVAATVRAIGQIIIYILVIWVTLRLSLSGPMTFTERQFRLFEFMDSYARLRLEPVCRGAHCRSNWRGGLSYRPGRRPGRGGRHLEWHSSSDGYADISEPASVLLDARIGAASDTDRRSDLASRRRVDAHRHRSVGANLSQSQPRG